MLFVKCPEPGLVKTRLATQLSDEFVANLYSCFIKDILNTLDNAELSHRIHVHHPEGNADCPELEYTQRPLYEQVGRDLGERMRRAFLDAFRHEYKSVIIIGSDLPDIPVEYIREGFRALQVKDCVIGPASDGGYYLLGFNVDTFVPEVFEDIPWSTDEVFNKTISILQSKSCNIHLLPELQDIDTLNDLKNFIHRNKDNSPETSHTLSFIAEQQILF